MRSWIKRWIDTHSPTLVSTIVQIGVIPRVMKHIYERMEEAEPSSEATVRARLAEPILGLKRQHLKHSIQDPNTHSPPFSSQP